MPTKSHTAPTAPKTPRTGDAGLTVTKAAKVLGVHPNTVRAWSDAGRLRYYRINERGDRRYRLTDLQRFMAAAESPEAAPGAETATYRPGRAARREPVPSPTLTESPAGLDLLADLAEVASVPSGLDPALDEACRRIRVATGAALVGIWERRPGGLLPRATDVEGAGTTAGRAVPAGASLFTAALASSEPIHARPGVPGPAPVLGLGTDELVVRIPGGEAPWGILVLAGAMELGPDDGRRLAIAIARTLGVLIRSAVLSEQGASRLRRSEALRRVATDLASRLDIGDVVRDLSDHARVLFGADRVAVVLRDAQGRISTPGGSGLLGCVPDGGACAGAGAPGDRRHPAATPGRRPRARRAAQREPGAGRRDPGGRGQPARRRRSSKATSSTACSISPTTGPTAGARRTSTPPRRSPATPPSRSGPPGPSGGWLPGRRSSSRSSVSGHGCPA